MPNHYFPWSRRTPANGVSRRPVPGPLAPDRCVQYERGVGESTVILVGVDLKGVSRVRVELASEDVSSWWIKVIRHWLAWCYGASEIKIVS